MLRALWWACKAIGYLVVISFVLNLPPVAIVVFVVVLVVVLDTRQRQRRRGVAS